MKFAAIIIVFPLLVTHCSRKPDISQAPTNGPATTVKEADSAPQVILAPDPGEKQPKLEEKTQEGAPVPTQLVRGQVMVVGQYCGGAAPSEEMMEEFRTPRPLADYPVMIHYGSDHRGTHNGRWLLQTDAQGYWEVKLSAGDYCLVAGEKTKSNPKVPQRQEGYLEVDARCYAEWLETCDQTFHVGFEEMKEDILLTLYAKCFIPGYDPCSQYTGPLPP